MKPLDLAIGTVLRGAGGGGSSAPRTPIESPDSLRSISYARILDLVSEGEIYGFSDQANPLSCAYLNETPVANADGSLNFKNVQIDSRVGTQVQDYLPGFDGVENEIGVATELRSDTPWTKTVTNLNLNALRVRLSTPALSKTNTSNGDVTGYTIRYRIELQVDSGTFVSMLESAFTGKTSSKYERTHRIDLPAATTSWTLRVVRVTANADTATIQDTMVVESYAEIIDAKLRMPMSALVSVVVDAEQFNNIPSRAYRIKGRIIKVPANYDPDTRTYSGVWDGTFKPAWSDNPAWVFYDMALNTRYGLGHLIDQSLVDKWSLYRIAQYCDQAVPNGFGGMEPRFTCNLCLQTQNDALRVMQDMATAFRGIIYATGNTVTAVADMPEDSVYTYNQANVIGGKFSYSGSSGKVRHTVALVSWNDPSDFYRAKVEYVESPEGIARYGIQQTEVIAIGCSSRGQARRWGLYLLTTEQLESDACTWSVGLDGTVVAPGKICKVADPLRANARTGGRISSATINSIITDAAPTTVAAGDKLVVILPSGISEERTILSIVDKTVMVTSNFSDVPVAQSVWAVESDTLALQMFRVLSVAELSSGDAKGYTIGAIQHVPGKFAFIDNNIKIDPLPIAPIPSNVVPSPTGLAVVARDVVEQNTVAKVVNLSWNIVPVANHYKVQWRMSAGSWVAIDKIGTTDTDLVGVGAGDFEVQVIAVDVLGRSSRPTFGGPYNVSVVQTPPGYVNDINDQFVSVTGELTAVGAQADQLRVDVDAAVAQVQVLQGQVGDILQADAWDSIKVYPSGDLIQHTGKLYRSLIDGNVGNEPTGATDANWEYIGNYASLGEAVSATAANVATLQNTVTQQGDTLTANSQAIAQNTAAIGDKADASALTTTNATVTQQGDQITSLAADITLLGAHNAGKTAFILDQSKVLIDPATTFAQMLTGLQASDTAVNSRVDNEQAARISGDNANASSITSLTARMGAVEAPGSNILPNPTAGAGQTGWTVTVAGFQPVSYEDGTYWFNVTNAGNEVSDPIPFGAGSTGTISVDMFAAGVTAGNFQAALAFYDASDVFTGVQAVVTAANGTTWKRYAATETAPSNTDHARVLFALGGGSVNTRAGVRNIKVEFGSVATPFTDNATVAQSATVTQALIASVGPGGAYAQATTMLDVNGRITGVSQTNNGTTGDFRILADKFSIESPAGGARTEYSAGNWRVYDSLGNLRVRMGIW